MAGTYGDLAANGSFTSGTTSWWSGDPAMITLVAPGTGLEASATTDAANLWDAPFGQDNIVLRQGVLYTLSFTARASQASTSLRAQVGLGVDPWTAAIDKTVVLDTVDTHFVLQFTSSLATTAGQLSFQMGQATEVTVYLTEVRLTCSTVREGFYVDPDSNAQKWVNNNPTDERAPKILKSIASRPGARWFGNWNTDIQADVNAYVTAAAAVGKMPILAAYNMYWRDNGGESSGGAIDPAAYRTWIDAFAAGIGNRPAIVIVEPDSLAQAEYLPTETARADRYALVTYAAQALAARPLVRAYLDGANATWVQPAEMAARLIKGGIAAVKTFAVGVANFDATDISLGYGNQVVAALANQGVTGAKFVIDTARNGNGAMDDNGQHVDYCNPAGRRLGVPSSIGVGGAEYLLWLKFPGDSDGQCGVAPADTPAGTFSPYLAVRLIDGW
ncbi:glycoside hydrolase family 6 protein [Streptomyces sp. NBC_00243]|uniref:glycoside hydrolase family 6 protein n=1 Tax=Streptomyces sp. NBC_00243 TaxID=2975688 RepID=UPI002DD9DD40|nr:glycoside hydrolase family 6 protein [Streptomyces sp. NBC_00243]WRZ24300.1 glycoside hydrolase family 6 protein [Streptomyces sp. NBC_00243]